MRRRRHSHPSCRLRRSYQLYSQPPINNILTIETNNINQINDPINQKEDITMLRVRVLESLMITKIAMLRKKV
jgi:hypothetical protein